MSERPSNKPETPAGSGWHQPSSTAGPWRAPEKKSAPAGWTKPTLPSDLETEPQTEGTWHLPAPEDTIYEQEAAPEAATQSAAAAEEIGETQNITDEPTEKLASPEDMSLYLSAERASADLTPTDEEDDPFSMSELVALASLSAGQATSATPAASAPLITPLAPTPDAAATQAPAPDTSSMSPAERALQQSASTPVAVPDGGGLSPEEYARRQLAALEGDDSATSGGLAFTGGVPAAAGELTPEEYARQQLAALGADEVGATTGALSPTQGFAAPQSEMIRKFQETQEQIQSLRRLYQAGQLSRPDLENQLRQLMVLDDNQVWWMMGVETDTWYRFENNEWVPATPPHLQQPQPAAGTGVLQPVDASLAYLPTEAPPQQTQQTTGGELRVDENFMPLPRQVPRQDPEYTVPSAVGVYLRDANSGMTQLAPASSAELTQPSPSYGAATVPTPSIGGFDQPVQLGSLVEAPYTPDAAPAESSSVYEEARERQRSSLVNWLILGVLGFLGLMLILGILATLAIVIPYNQIANQHIAEVQNLQSYVPQFQTARILDINGDVIAELNSQEANAGARTTLQSLDQISPYMIFAVVASENERFFEDPGFDPIAIARAFWQNYTSGTIESGASTITQQIARNLILQNTAPTATRKLEELIVANQIANEYSKNEILLLYLNEVYFGNLAYGVEEASQFYFGHSAATLDFAESAFLTGLIQSPALYDPVTSRDAAFARMRDIIRQMVTVRCETFQHGQWAEGQPQYGQPFCIPDNTVRYDSSGQVVGGPALPLIAQVEARNYIPRDSTVQYPHFVQFVQAQLERDFGTSEIYSRGFTVYTTLNPRIQDAAQDALSSGIGSLVGTGVNTGAVLVTDPNTGAILAMVGSPDFNNADIDGQINYTLTWEQPGSSIKPIVYTAAINGIDRNGDGQYSADEYLTPASILWDVPTVFPGNYQPVNFDGQFHGPTALRYALDNSYNVPSVKVYDFVGNDAFRQMAELLGLTFLPEAQFGLPTGIGATEVRLYDMVQAYGTLATGGIRVQPYAIARIVDSTGAEVPVPARNGQQQVIRAETAYLMQNILSDDSARQPQFPANSVLTIRGLPTQNTVAVKTGTSNENRDLWTLGFTRNYVVGVWIGRGDNQPTTGSSFSGAAPIWNAVMLAALNNQAPPAFTQPANVGAAVICADTGTLPADSCTNRRNEIFIVSQPPPQPDQGFIRTVAVDTWTGLLANQFCQDNVVQGTFASITDAAAVDWLNNNAQGRSFASRLGLPLPLQQAPTAGCDLNTPLPVVRMTQPINGQTVNGSLQITGAVSAPNFSNYQIILLRPDGTQVAAYGPFTTQAPNMNSVLYTLDTRTIPDGDYLLRLDVRSTTNGYADIDASVRIDNPDPTAIPTVAPTITQPPSVFTTPLPFDTVIPAQSFPTPTATINPGG
ncbi:MAG: transglycosylase domain-containing protein [Anaerolineae bacterium]